MMDVDFADLKMEGRSTRDKRRAVHDTAYRIASCMGMALGSQGRNGGKALFVGPIDHGGTEQAWRYIEEPLRAFSKGYDVEVITPDGPLRQSPGYDSHSEFRPVLTGASRFRNKRVGAILMVDNSASGSGNIIGPSIMGGMVWACENRKYFGNEGEGVIIANALVRDLGRHGVGNFACYTDTEDWYGPRRHMRECMPHTFEQIGGDTDGSPFKAIQDWHYSAVRAGNTCSISKMVLGALGLKYLGAI